MSWLLTYFKVHVKFARLEMQPVDLEDDKS